MWGRHKRPRSLPMTGECVALPLPKPPLMVRGGVERSETEGIRKLDFDKVNRNADINPQKGRHLLCPFCPYEMRSMSRKGRELCPVGTKREGKPRFSGAALRAHAVVSPFNLSAEFSNHFFLRKNGAKRRCKGRCRAERAGGDKEVGFRYSKSNHRQTIPQSAALTAPFAQGSHGRGGVR